MMMVMIRRRRSGTASSERPGCERPGMEWCLLVYTIQRAVVRPTGAQTAHIQQHRRRVPLVWISGRMSCIVCRLLLLLLLLPRCCNIDDTTAPLFL